MASLDRILDHRRALERALGRDPGVDVAAADLDASLGEPSGPGELALARAVSREEARARRSHRPYVILRMEAPGLLSAAAAYGGLFAEAARARLEEVVRASVRQSDALFALSPGSLALLLPETPSPGAQALASRLQGVVAEAFREPFLGREAPVALRPTWSELGPAGGVL